MTIKNIFIKFGASVSAFTFLAMPLATVTAAQYHTVGVYDNYFSPNTTTINVGDVVTFTNHGNMNHTVTSDNGSFNSGVMMPGSSLSITFNSAGTYNYYCQFHPGMTGRIIVASGGSGSNTISGTVASGTPLTVNYITQVKTSGAADGTFENGWKYIFDITAPLNETNLTMKFSNWFGASNMPVVNNIRFYSTQSSNANNQSNAIYITASNTYSNTMALNGNLGGANGRHIQITVEVRIPTGTSSGTYSTNFGIQTQ